MRLDAFAIAVLFLPACGTGTEPVEAPKANDASIDEAVLEKTNDAQGASKGAGSEATADPKATGAKGERKPGNVVAAPVVPAPTRSAFRKAAKAVGLSKASSASRPVQVGQSRRFVKLFATQGALHLVAGDIEGETGAVLANPFVVKVFSMDEARGHSYVLGGDADFDESRDLDSKGHPRPGLYMAGKIISTSDLDSDDRAEVLLQIRGKRMCCGIGPLQSVHRVLVDLEKRDVQLDILLSTLAGSYEDKGAVAWRDSDVDGHPDLMLTTILTQEEAKTTKTYSARYDPKTDRYVGALPAWTSDMCCPDEG